MKRSTVLMPLVSLLMATGCSVAAPADEDNEFLAEAQGALLSHNELSDNALDKNALDKNALDKNALDKNALDKNAMPSAALDSIQDPSADGALARSFVRYLVTCAFDDSQSFSFSWTDYDGVVHDEQYNGHLGLAPNWANGPLSLTEARDVSGCMGAHVNYYGVSVVISVRSGHAPLRLHPQDDELQDYSRVEGAFWGNIFAPQPYLNACFNAANVDHSRSLLRDCATGHVRPDGTTEDCGMMKVVGSCQDACLGFNPARGYYPNCFDKPGINHAITSRLITTALP